MGAMAAAFMGVGKVLPASLRLFFPLKNIIHPIRLSPVYFPAWVVNAEIHADVTQEDETVGYLKLLCGIKFDLAYFQRNRSILFQNWYVSSFNGRFPSDLRKKVTFQVNKLPRILLPMLRRLGSQMAPLCAAPLWAPDFVDRVEPIPFSQTSLSVYGQDVLCIPFTTSPFKWLDIARNLSWRQATLNEKLKFSPSSVTPALVRLHRICYPPIYLNDVPVLCVSGSASLILGSIRSQGCQGRRQCLDLLYPSSFKRCMSCKLLRPLYLILHV